MLALRITCTCWDHMLTLVPILNKVVLLLLLNYSLNYTVITVILIITMGIMVLMVLITDWFLLDNHNFFQE